MRGRWGVGAAALMGALALVAVLPLAAGSANAREPRVPGHVSVGSAGLVRSAGSVVDIETAVNAVAPPTGFNRVGTRFYELGGDDAPEHLTVAEAKFNGLDRSAVTVVFIEGGVWDLGQELAVAGERRGAEVSVARRVAALVEGDMSKSISWLQSEGMIIQIVVRGAQITRDGLVRYAESVAEEAP